MKLSKSKLALANIINENGGWRNNAAIAIFGKHLMECAFVHEMEGKVKYNSKTGSWQISKENYLGGFKMKPFANWHQTILGREEYYQAYPKADADGWIEWRGGDCPVERGTLVDVKYSGGEENFGVSALTEGWHDDHVRGSNGKRTAVNWVDILPVSGIVAYRLHKQEVKPELCESAMRSIPEPETKPTIEHLAQDYRNKLDFANSKRREADDAKADADAALGELKRAGEVLGLVIDIANPEPELVITDWRDLRVGDEVECIKDNIGNKYSGVIGVVQSIDYGDASTPVCVDIEEVGVIWCHKVKFIRRP